MRAIARLFGKALICSILSQSIWAEDEPELTPQERRERALGGSVSIDRLPDTPQPLEAEVWAKTIDLLPNGGWQYITVTGADELLFASTRNVAQAGPTVAAWFRWEYMTAQSDEYSTSYHSLVVREEVDCSRQAMRSLASAYYSKNNLGGASSSFVTEQKLPVWSPAIPGTIGDTMVTWACSKLKHSPKTSPR